MSMSAQQTNYLRHIMSTLWANWIVAIGALALELFFPRILPLLGLSKVWLPLPIFIMAYAMACYERFQVEHRGPNCTAMLHVSGLTMFWSALIMFIINVLNSKMLFDGIIDWSNSNRDIPFITCLVMFPVMTVISIWVISRGYVQNMAEGYRARHGMLPGNGAVATLFSMETRFQVRLMLFISLAMNVVEWWYYLVYYFNTNMNTPDVFFFNWLPITVFGLTLILMANRYRSLATIIGPIAVMSHEKGVAIRFIVISGDRILLSRDTFGRWDTPALTGLSPLDAKNENNVREAFGKISGTDDFSLRYLYDTKINNDLDMLHYAVFIKDEKDVSSWSSAEWKTIDEIDRIIKNAGMAAEFTDEIYRIFTITIAWKTYDSNGRRIYPIKNYRPSFKIRDLKDWNVDYSDLHWLDVARNNQDRPFYHTKRFWRRITGFKVG